jgi:hypothetical protein
VVPSVAPQLAACSSANVVAPTTGLVGRATSALSGWKYTIENETTSLRGSVTEICWMAKS